MPAQHADTVVAHVLLNAFSVIAGRAATMRVAWEQLEPERREHWLADMERIAVEAAQLCDHLVRGTLEHPSADVVL